MSVIDRLRNPNTQFFCETCSRYSFKCGNCGNNACNGGVGKMQDGSDCDRCEDNYREDMNTPQPRPSN
jgi:hypothetical protein